METVRRIIMKRLLISTFIFAIAVIASGCTSSPTESIYQTLEETAVKEKEFQLQQGPLADLEKAENELFDEILTLGMKEFDEISKLADEAMANLDEREKLLKKEKESLDASKEAFKKAEEEITKLKDEKLNKQASELQSLMKKRYESYEKLYNTYNKGIAEDRKIYEMIKDKELKMEDLQTQIDATNKAYENVFEANNEFNELTEKFNEAKVNFYKESGIQLEDEK